ncbi:dTDP-4-dehydrorhamnose 3,5-epimerase [Colwellia sp. 39_35_sub15_T18]|nr:dTDP-4-dehydrorhamnose 3,5-epimerase [Colwellia sp. 39_35_sub15_T18]
MSRFTVTDLPLAGLKLIERQVLDDQRGFFSRLFCAAELEKCGWHQPIAQINHTYSAKKGTVRGLHFQHAPFSEVKLVSCLQGEIWDVVVDLRVDSPTFLRWHGEKLSAGNARALLIPEGFAHGFQTLNDNVQLLYCHSAAFQPNAEAGLNILDPRLAIVWPLPISECSQRDQVFPFLDDQYSRGVI